MKQQMSTFLTLMQNYDKEQQYEKDEANSSGSAMKKYQDYMNSIEAKTNQAKTAMHNLFSDIGNSDVIKGVISAFTGFINTLDYLIKDAPVAGVAILGLSTAFIALTASMKAGTWATTVEQFANFKTAFAADAAEMGTMTTGLGLLKNGFGSLLETGGAALSKLAMNPLTWVLGGIALIGTLTAHMKELHDATTSAQSTMKDLNTAMKNQDISGIDSGLSAIKQEQQKLNDMKEKADKYNTITGFLFGGINGSANDYADYKQRLKADEQGGYKIDSSGKIDTSKYDKEEKSLKQLQSVTDDLSSSVDTQTSKTAKLIQEYIKLSSNTNKTKSQQKEQASVVDQLKSAFGDLTISIDKSGNVTIKNIDTLKNHADQLNADAQAVADDKQQQDQLAQTMTDAQDNIKEYSKYIKDANDNSGHFTSVDVEEIEKKHAELIPYLTNEADLYKQIQDAINGEKDTANKAYEQMMESSDAYWKENDSAKQSMIDGVNELAKKDNGYFQTKAKEYLADIDNAKSMKEAEVAIEKDLVAEKEKIDKGYQEAVNKFEQDEVNGKASEKDAQSAADAKKKLDDITKQQSDWDAMEKKARSQIKAPSVIDDSDETSEGLNKTTNSLKEQKQQAEQDKLEMKDYNNEINALKLSEKALDDALQNTNQHSQEAINLLSRKAELIKQEISLTQQQIKTQEALASAYSSGNYNSSSSSYSGTSSSSGSLGSWKNSQYASAVTSAASKYGVDPNLVAAIIQQESSWNQNSTSSVGAIGLMQLMPSTASSLGVNPYNASSNIEGGTKYIAQLLQEFGGDLTKAIAAYNAGAGAVQKYGGVPPYSETQDYVKKVEGYYQGYGGNISSAMDNQKNAEQAQANALQLKGNLLDLQQTLSEIPFQQFQDRLGIMEDAVESFNNQVSITKDTIANFNDSLSHQSQVQRLWEQGNVALVNKAKELQQEYNYVQSQLSTGGYTDSDYAQMKLKLTQIQDDIVKVRAEEDDLAKTWIDTITNEYSYEINYQDKLATRYQTAAEVMKTNYSEVAKYRQMSVDYAMKKHQDQVDEINWLTSQINSGRFDEKTVENMTDKLRTLQDEELQYVETLQKMKSDLIDANFDKTAQPISENIDLLKSQLDLLNKIGVGYNDALKTSIMNDLLNQQLQYQGAIRDTISSLKDQMDALEQTGKAGGSQYVWLKEEYDKYLKDLETSTSDIYESVSNVIKEQVDVEENAWDKEQKIFDRKIQAQEKAIDTAKNNLTWLETQENDLSSAKDIRTQLVRLQADNSPQNQSKIRELEQQLVSANKKTNEDVVNHRIETEKQGLEDLKTNEDQKISDAKDKLTDLVNSTQANIAKALESLLDKNNGDITKIGQQIQDTILSKIDYIKQSVGDIVDMVNNSSGNPFDINSLANNSSLSSMSSSNRLLNANISGLQYKGISMPSAEKVTNNDNSQSNGDTYVDVKIDNRGTKMNAQQLGTTVVNEIKKKSAGRVFTK